MLWCFPQTRKRDLLIVRRKKMMFTKIGSHCLTLLIVLAVCMQPSQAQKHYAGGENVIRGNRLISVRSEAGKALYQPDRMFVERSIRADGVMSEPAWQDAPLIAPFSTGQGGRDQTTVRVLYDGAFIYLFWQVDERGGITAAMTKADSVITADDYIQVDLKPLFPDSIKYARNHYYTIAVNPKGVEWDAYFDPYLDGFFFSSWDAGADIAVTRNGGAWTAEMRIPYAGLDLYADRGWQWLLEFRHSSSISDGVKQMSAPNIGVVVQQDVMVRRPALVSYYWPRPEFMQEVKPDMRVKQERTVQAVRLDRAPAVNAGADAALWRSAAMAEIGHGDRMGDVLAGNRARAKFGITETQLCCNLEADGARSAKRPASESALGEGMAAQMAGVNGVFVDQALFANECFWVIVQPHKAGADHIHQDYYVIIVDNHGGIRATHYDAYGAPSRAWNPDAQIDLYDTDTGWGAEVIVNLSSFDLSPTGADTWGLNVFRNRLLPGDDYELQAWRYTGNDFFNPETFGRLTGVPAPKAGTVRAGMARRIEAVKEKTAGSAKSETSRLLSLLNTSSTATMADLIAAENTLQQAEQDLGVLDAAAYYASVPHPVAGGYPLMDIQFIGDHGWAVGAMGTIKRSEDGGGTWQTVNLASDADLYRVDFVDALHGWAVGGRLRIAESNAAMRHDKRGGYAYIYATRDGGKSWQCQYGERGRLLLGLDFIDKNTGYACGERGILLKTEDGGAHWRELPTTGTMHWLYGMTFRDARTGFAVGLRETVIKTSDGGLTWKKLVAPADRQFYGFRPIYRDITFNGDTGCIVGQNGTVLISQDGGDSWQPTATFFQPKIRELLDLRRVEFVTPREGYAVGEMGTRMMVTEDGGASWSYRPVADTEWLRAIWANSDGKVVIAGEREKVMISTDKGFTWKTTQGERPKADILVMMAHGDDAALQLNPLFAHYCINQDKTIVDVGVMSDTHSSEYEETYNLEHDRNMWMVGVRTATNFDEFETGNNGSDYYHFTERLREGDENVVWHMVAAIRAYRPDIVITHDGVYGDYDKPGHKVSGRAGLPAFESAGGDVDQWPELTRLGLPPWQPRKLYHVAGESYPATLDLSSLAEQPLRGTDGTCMDYAEYAIRNFQSQGVYHARIARLSLVKSRVPVPEQETSVFDGL
jgi:photosystem II stability/assembly factor-like uncharacterized protein